MQSNKGFTLIEVLIASIILFLSVVTVSLAYKQYESNILRQRKYEMIYINAISLMNKILNKNIFAPTFYESGTINGMKYKINAKVILSKRNYIYGFSEQLSGNKGNFVVKLYKITIELNNLRLTLYKTEFSKVL